MLPAFRRIDSRRAVRYFHRSALNYNDISTLYKNESRKSGEVNVDVPVPPDVHDFALDARPVGAFACFSQPNCYNSPEFKLSSAQLAQYAKDGYVSNVPVLSSAECEQLIAEVETIVDPRKPHRGRGLLYELHYNQSGDPNNVLAHILGHWRLSAGLHDLAFHPGLACRTSQLFGGRGVRFWHDQLFIKPARHGGNVAWHQDYSYWTRTVPMCHMTVHIALDDQTEENGTLMFIPGSQNWHRGGLPLPITADDFGDMNSILSVLTPEERAAFKPVPAMLKRGEASFHHPLLVHGSFANRSDTPRRAAVINYFADGTVSNTDDEIVKGVRVAKGSPMTGKLFPLVYSPLW